MKPIALPRLGMVMILLLLAVILSVSLLPARAEETALRLYAYVDANMDGLPGEKEAPAEGVSFQITQEDGSQWEGLTGKDGCLELTLPEGSYTLTALCPEGYGVSVLDGDASFAGTTRSASLVVELPCPEEISCGIVTAGGMEGMVFEDVNGDGLLDEGDTPVSGVTIHAVHNKTGVETLAVSDENGDYCLVLPLKGKYTITADIPEGMLYTRYCKTGGDLRSIFSRDTVTREFTPSGKVLTNKNIGIIQQGAIYGNAFLDLNYNGLWDDGEPAVAGVTVEVIKVSNDTSYGKVKTDKSGYFYIENLRGGDYRLRAVLPEDGSIFTRKLSGDAASVNLFEQRGSRRESSIEPLTITSGAQVQALIGIAQGATITGKVFTDSDYSGAQNGKEKAISGIKVRAVAEDGTVVAEGTTGAKGSYTLSGILPGSYRVEFQRKAGYGFTRCRSEQKSGSHVQTIQDEWGICEYLTIAMGEEITDINAGMLPAAKVTGSLIHDSNDNSTPDKGETGLAGAQVRLWSEDAEMDFTAAVAEDGSFTFAGVMPGLYSLEYLLPEHCEMTVGEQLSTDCLKVVSGESYDLEPACAVELGSYAGCVLDSTGGGVEGAVIRLKGGSTEKTESASDGSFSLTGLRPGSYQLSIDLPEGYMFAADTDEDGIAYPWSGSVSSDISWEALISRSQKEILAAHPGSIQGEIWMDENKDGLREPAEWIMTGLQVELYSTENGEEPLLTVQTTDSGYAFNAVRPGSYRVCFALPEQASPAGEEASSFTQNGETMISAAISLAEGEAVGGMNTGLVSTTSIGGKIRLSAEGDTLPLEGAKVELLLDGNLQGSATTGEDGAYRFDGLWPGNYSLRVTLPYGAIFIREEDPAFAADASVVHAESGSTAESPAFTLSMAQHLLSMDVLCMKPAIIGDIAWLDENGNGLLDGEERRIPGVTLQLCQEGEVCYETVTDAFGYYLFSGVYPGEYVLRALAYDALTPTVPVPQLRIISSCLTSGDGSLAESDTFTAVSGSKDMNYDVGYVLLPGEEIPEEILQEAPTKDWTLINEAERVIY